MKTIKKLFAPKEVKVALNVLDELSLEFQTEAFKMIGRQIEDAMLGDCKKVVSEVEDGTSPHHIVYFAIANFAGEHVESGYYHIYRGVLNPLGIGNDLLSLFDMAVDRLLEGGAVDEKKAKEQKEGIRRNIKGVG